MIKYTILLIILLSASLLTTDEASALSGKYELAERLYLQGDYKEASYECEKLLQRYKAKRLRNEIAYLAGLSYLKLNNISKSKEYFESVLRESNDPLLLDEAKILLAYMSKKDASIKEPLFFSIQIGSFKDKNNAQRLFEKFKKRRYTVRVTEEDNGKDAIYKVKIGRFKTRKDAAFFAKKLKRMGYPTAIVGY